jgi:hypothetical protein
VNPTETVEPQAMSELEQDDTKLLRRIGDGDHLPEPPPSRHPRDLPDALPSLRPLPRTPRALPRDLFKGLGCNPVRLGAIALGQGD